MASIGAASSPSSKVGRGGGCRHIDGGQDHVEAQKWLDLAASRFPASRADKRALAIEYRGLVGDNRDWETDSKSIAQLAPSGWSKFAELRTPQALQSDSGGVD